MLCVSIRSGYELTLLPGATNPEVPAIEFNKTGMLYTISEKIENDRNMIRNTVAPSRNTESAPNNLPFVLLFLIISNTETINVISKAEIRAIFLNIIYFPLISELHEYIKKNKRYMDSPIAEYLKSGDFKVSGKTLRISIIIRVKKIITKYSARNNVKSDIFDSFN